MTKTYQDAAQSPDKQPYKFSCFTLDGTELELTAWRYPPPTWSEAERTLLELATLSGIAVELVDLGTVRMERLNVELELRKIMDSK